MKKNLPVFVAGALCGTIATLIGAVAYFNQPDQRNTTRACLDLAHKNMVAHHGEPGKSRITEDHWYVLRSKMQADCVASMRVFNVKR